MQNSSSSRREKTRLMDTARQIYEFAQQLVFPKFLRGYSCKNIANPTQLNRKMGETDAERVNLEISNQYGSLEEEVVAGSQVKFPAETRRK